jgi:hypothetical protein
MQMNGVLSNLINISLFLNRKTYWFWVAVAVILMLAVSAIYVDPTFAGPAPGGSYCGSC